MPLFRGTTKIEILPFFSFQTKSFISFMGWISFSFYFRLTIIVFSVIRESGRLSRAALFVVGVYNESGAMLGQGIFYYLFYLHYTFFLFIFVIS